MLPEVGDSYLYNGTQIGELASRGLVSGTTVNVRDLVPANVSGAHNDTEDSVVVEWTKTETVIVDTELVPYPAAVVQTDPDTGLPVVDDSGEVVMKIEKRVKANPVFGEGQVCQAMSVSVDFFAANFSKVEVSV